MKTEVDLWACRVCRSINGLRAALWVMWQIEDLFRARVAKGVPATAEPASS